MNRFKAPRRAVLALIATRTPAPTLLEIATEALDSAAPHAAGYHVNALERLGYVTKTGEARGLSITDAGRRALESSV